jgi:O-antigen ligase
MRRITIWLAVLLVFLVPWEDSISISSLGSLAKIVGLVVAIAWMATILMEGKFRKPHLFHAIVLLFFIWNTLGLMWSPDQAGTIQRVKTYIQLFLLLLIFWETFQKPEHLMASLQAYIFGTYILIASTFYNYITGNVSVTYEGRYSATGVNAVDLALILILGMPIAMQLFFVDVQNIKGVILKIINLSYIPLAVFATILTGSRTSLIAAVPFGIYLVGTKQIRFDRKLILFGIILISLLIMLPFIPQSLTARLGTVGSSIGSGDIGGRVELWRQSLLIFTKHPLLGLGGGTLSSAIGSVAHNTFVSVLAETGIIGFGLFAMILVVTFITAVNIPNGNSGLWICIFLIWVIGVSSLSWDSKKLTWLLLNFIVIEGSFSYGELQIKQSKMEISSRLHQFFNRAEPEITTEVD